MVEVPCPELVGRAGAVLGCIVEVGSNCLFITNIQLYCLALWHLTMSKFYVLGEV